ncbi:hypothetical protein Tco_0625849 [Tanacetum coccineum]|uniref:Retrovirus-related Pol polyprotein from transposon TNT 1-94 n=1 Tax=Tanacetum coccineum TaxID=301880 RepID=A0ABQ4WHW8_9ASTR
MKSKRCRQNTRHRRRPHEREKGRNVRGRRTLEERKEVIYFSMHQSKSKSEHIDEFHNMVGDLAAIDTTISNEDHALLLLTSLPSSYDNVMETLLYGRETLKLEDVLATLNSRELQKMMEAKGDGGGREEAANSDQVSGSGADEYDSADVMLAMSVEELSTQQCMKSGVARHLGVAGYSSRMVLRDKRTLLAKPGDGVAAIKRRHQDIHGNGIRDPGMTSRCGQLKVDLEPSMW